MSGDASIKNSSEGFEELKDVAEEGLITSIEFINELRKLAKDTIIKYFLNALYET